jgi:hypothetical protein
MNGHVQKPFAVTIGDRFSDKMMVQLVGYPILAM